MGVAAKALAALVGILLGTTACPAAPQTEWTTRMTHGGPGFPIVDHGAAAAVIYLPATATPTAKYAAEELRDHIRLATGVELSITPDYPEDAQAGVILVGPSDRATALGVTGDGLGKEGFRLKSGPNWLVLLGNDDDKSPFIDVKGGKHPNLNGTLWAVYHFLREHVGVRWYMPGELGTVVPGAKTLISPGIDLTSAPALQRRQAQIVYSGKPLPNPGDWSPTSELGRWYLRQGFGRDSRTTHNHTFHFLTGGGWSTYSDGRDFPKTKPHIFAVLPDGSYDFETTSYGEGNLNLSEPDTLKEFVEMVRDRFDSNPELLEMTVAPNDVWQPCMSEGSLAAIPADLRERIRREARLEVVQGTARYQLPPELMEEFRRASSQNLWRFAAAVAEEVYKTHPDRLVGVIAGYMGGDPPDGLEFPPNFSAIYTKTRAAFVDREYKARVRRELEAWSRVTPHLDIWEYYLWYGRPWRGRPQLDGYPVLFSQILQMDFDMTRGRIAGEYSQNWHLVHPRPGLGHLMQHLTARLLFDPALKVRDLLDEYYTLFYGAAREPMREFWQLAETCWMRDSSDLDARSQSAEIIDRMYPVEDLARFFDLLSQAKSLVPEGSPEYRRIALLESEMEINRPRVLFAPVKAEHVFGPWSFRKDPEGRGVRERWYARPSGQLPATTAVPVPSVLSKTDVGPYLGTGWYETTLAVPEEAKDRRLQLHFDGIDEQAWIYLNGTLIGEQSEASTGLAVDVLWRRAFHVDIPPALLDASGVNRLVVRTHASVNEHGIWKPVRLMALSATDAPPPVFSSSYLFPAPQITGSYQKSWPGNAFILFDEHGRPAAPATRVKVGHDPRFLYVTFHCEEDSTAALPAARDGGDWAWRHGDIPRPRQASNTFEIQLQPGPDAYASVMVNVSGRVADFLASRADRHAQPADWQSGARADVQTTDSGWSGTVAIPWESLGVQPSPGMTVKANFFRTRPGSKTASWSPAPAAWTPQMFLERGRERFGSLVFPEE